MPDAAIAAAVPEAEVRYERDLAEKAEREQAKLEAEAAAEECKAQLLAGDAPAVVVIDGQAWLRDEDGRYTAQGDDNDADSWSDLIEWADAADIGPIHATVADFDTAMAAAAADEVSA